MQLYVLRHGDAERFANSDRQRQLTERGRQEVLAVIERHRAELAGVEIIFHSPYARAQQTAALVNREFPGIPLQSVEMLTPNNIPIDVVKILCQQQAGSTLLLVSHQPLVSELVGNLCDLPPATVNMHTAALASIKLEPVAIGMGELQFVD